MRSRPEHPDAFEILELSETDWREHPHLVECQECRRKVTALAEGLELIRATERPIRPPVRKPDRSLAAAVPLAKRADEIGRRLVTEAENGVEPVIATFEYSGDLALPDGLIAACQLGASLAARKPRVALSLAQAVRATARGEVDRRHPLRPFILVEALLLTSQAVHVLGRAREAAKHARRAERIASRYGAPPLTLARCWYFEASALVDADEKTAMTLASTALKVFQAHGQDQWVGRAEIALGLVHFGDDRPSEEALAFFDAALTHLDPELDAHSVAAATNNRASVLHSLGRLDEARAGYQAALQIGLRINHEASIILSKVQLLDLALEEGKTGEVILRAEKVIGQAENAGLDEHAFYARLAYAEALALSGRMASARRVASHLWTFREAEMRLNTTDAKFLAMLRRLRDEGVGAEGTGRPANA